MSESQKKVLVIIVAVAAVCFAGYMGFNTMSGEKEQVVGTLDMGPGGGRDAEKGKVAGGDPSGMPPEMAGNPMGEGKQ